MLNEATLEYISRHKDDDVRVLALRGCKNAEVDLPMALQQIQGRQTARRKLPSWAAIDGIVYPPHLNMEQCSSEFTARYKAEVISNLALDNSQFNSSHSFPPNLRRQKSANSKFFDLTGGFGVDFAFISSLFSEAVYVERDERLCAIAAHNFRILGLSNVTTVCADSLGGDGWKGGEDGGSPALSRGNGRKGVVIFLDPARRDAHGSAQIVNGNFANRKYSALADCTPNVIAMMPDLMLRADYVLLKLSPMLDWHKAIADLAPYRVLQVHIVAVDNECKELLLLLTSHGDNGANETTGATEATGTTGASGATEPATLICTDICSSDGSCTRYIPIGSRSPIGPIGPISPIAPSYLYSPNAAVMKAGCFRELSADFGIPPLSANSHLFTSDRLIDDFPGRRFRIKASCSMNKRDLKATLGHLHQANIAVRNFPLTADQLRSRLKLTDGGPDYIFATTMADNTHILILCEKDS